MWLDTLLDWPQLLKSPSLDLAYLLAQAAELRDPKLQRLDL